MAAPSAPPEEAVRDAIDALSQAEKLIAGLDRAGILERLDQLRDFVEEITRLQVDLRIAKLRLQAHLRPEDDPDKTPVHGISTAKLRIAELTKK